MAGSGMAGEGRIAAHNRLQRAYCDGFVATTIRPRK